MFMSAYRNQLHVDEALDEGSRHLHSRKAHRACINHLHGRVVVLHEGFEQFYERVGWKLHADERLLCFLEWTVCIWRMELSELCNGRAARSLQVNHESEVKLKFYQTISSETFHEQSTLDFRLSPSSMCSQTWLILRSYRAMK